MLDRFLYRDNSEQGTPVDQSINQKPTVNINSLSDPEYFRSTEFPQPMIAGIGYVTSAGAIDTAKFFYSQAWSVTKNSTGNYTITHNIGDNTKYLPIFNLIGSADRSFVVNNINNNTVDILTFNQAGTATDTAFMFVFYLNL